MVCRYKTEFEELEIDSISLKQERYIDAIERYKFTYKKVPTIRTICKLMGVSSTSTVHIMLKTLKEKGYDYRAL